MTSQFQRNSGFSQPTPVPRVSRSVSGDGMVHQGDNQKSPSQQELERWYGTLVALLERESDGDMDHTIELTDLRDEIYAYLY